MNTLWNPSRQVRRIFGWKSILENWSHTLIPSRYVDEVVENLRAASNPSSNYDFPVHHFLTFLNDEEEGIKWLIYESVVLEWMYGNIRTDYLAALVEKVDIDSGFPTFVGSPLNTLTVRKFLEDNLNSYQLGQVNMMPRLVRTSIYQNVNKRPSAFQLRFIRKDNYAGQDDIMSITDNGDYTYNLLYNDQFSKVKAKMTNVTRQQLMKHLSNSLRLITLDSDPFESVQVIAPAAPSVLLPTFQIGAQTRDLIYDTLESVMDSWPHTV